MDDRDDIVKSVEDIRKKYRTELVDEEEQQLSFVDEINALIKKIFKDDPIDAYTALSEDNLAKWKNKKFRRWLIRSVKKIDFRSIFYFTLLACITAFLVSEAVSFYAVEGVLTFKTYAKALLTETCFIFLSGFRASGKLQTAVVSALRVSIFCLMLFVISSDVTTKGIGQTTEISGIQEQIELLEDRIDEREEMVEYYKNKDWGVNAKKQMEKKNQLSDQLLELKKKQTKGKNTTMSDMVVYKTWGKAAFRVILLLISVLISRRLFKF